MEWLRKQRTQYKGGRKRKLKENEKEGVWSMMKKYGNKSMVADLLGVSRRSIIRFLKKYPIPKTFVVEESMNLLDFPEMQIWLKRIKGFANQRSINTYLGDLRAFYKYMKHEHPERAKPSLWTSDDITEYVYAQPKHLWHRIIVALRSLALKAQTEFPQIDLGLLPTKRTHKAKRSLAGHEEYYYKPEQVDVMIQTASTKKTKSSIAVLYNLACRSIGFLNARIENLNLEQHRLLIKDKGGIWWDTYGMTDRTAQLLSEYLEERGWPKSGWLFVNNDGNGNETKMTSRDLNKMIKEIGKKAGITGKIMTAKAFRKSFVENYFKISDADPMILAGSGKGDQGQPKTSFGVGWTLEVLMKYYAPKMKKQIAKHRQKFVF